MRKIHLLPLCIVAFFNNVLVGQVNIDVFEQLQENVLYLPIPQCINSISVVETNEMLQEGPDNDFNYLVEAVKGNSELLSHEEDIETPDTAARNTVDGINKGTLKEFSLINTTDYIINHYGDSIWGNISSTPLRILLITDSLEYLINHNDPGQSFEWYQYDSLLKTDIYVRKRKFPPFLRATFPAVNGIDCIVVGDCKNTEKSDEDWIIMLLHEHFHLYQGANPKYNENISLLAKMIANESDNWMLDYDFPYNDTTLNNLFKNYSSSIYETFNNLYKKEFNPEIEGWLADQAKIQNVLNSNDYTYFQFQLWQEGIATYTEYKYLDILNLNSEYFRKNFNLDFTLKDKEILTAYSTVLLNGGLQKNKRNLFYSLGLYIGMIKDKTNPEWKTDYFNVLHVE